MPCWEVQTMSVEFKAANKELIIKALEANQYRFVDRGKTIMINTSFGPITLDLEAQQALLDQNQQQHLNELKQAYSEQVLKEVARKRKWLLKKQQQRKYQLKRA